MLERLKEQFGGIRDPRREHPNKLHKLVDILVIAVCAVIAKCDTWDEIEAYGEAKQEFLRKFLELTNGIPSHDTFNRVFSLIDPKVLLNCFSQWMQSLKQEVEKGRSIQIDGKTLRGSKSSGKGKREEAQLALHLMSAWASEHRLVLAQIAVSDKSNEITAIPELLKLLDLEGAVVSIDAMGCHKEIAQQIVEQGGDYILALKGNHENLHKAANELFDDQLAAQPLGQEVMDTITTFDVAHGRQEQRKCWIFTDFERLALADCNLQAWTKLSSIIVVESVVLRQGKSSTDRRFYLSSLHPSAEDALSRVRNHWSIENQQHYPLDVTFREDASRTRKGFGPPNQALLRRIALNLLNLDHNSNLSLPQKRFKALLDDSFLLYILGLSTPC